MFVASSVKFFHTKFRLDGGGGDSGSDGCGDCAGGGGGSDIGGGGDGGGDGCGGVGGSGVGEASNWSAPTPPPVSPEV